MRDLLYFGSRSGLDSLRGRYNKMVFFLFEQTGIKICEFECKLSQNTVVNSLKQKDGIKFMKLDKWVLDYE